MSHFDIASLRLQHQQISSSNFTNPEDLVSWFGAVQAQDFAAAKWALSLRTQNHVTDAAIEQAFNDGKIIRTHIMRPTWHFVASRDIRWMLALTAPRVLAFSGYYFRKSGLTREVFQKSNRVIQKALTGGKQLSRSDLKKYLTAAKLPVEDLGLSFIIMQAELAGLICSGPRIGKQFTYMLLGERAPNTLAISHDEALAELSKRYFQSHGPAQLQDFSWWSGLTVSDAQKGIAMLGSALHKKEIRGKTYWFFDTGQTAIQKYSDAFLLPGFDEYYIAYKDRSEVLDPIYAKQLNAGGGMLHGAIVAHGKMVGGWKRSIEKKEVVVKLTYFEKITPQEQESVRESILRYSRFLKLPVAIVVDASA